MDGTGQIRGVEDMESKGSWRRRADLLGRISVLVLAALAWAVAVGLVVALIATAVISQPLSANYLHTWSTTGAWVWIWVSLGLWLVSIVAGAWIIMRFLDDLLRV